MKNESKYTGDIRPLLMELDKLRWDEFDSKKLQNEWKRFFDGGRVEDFYLGTLEDILNAGLEVKKERAERMSRVIKALKGE